MMDRKWSVLLLGIMVSVACRLPAAQASELDSYREMLRSNMYTIRYENLTPAPRVTNRDRMELFGKSGMAVDENEYFANRPKSGILVGNGKDKYEEVGDASFKMCRLTKGDENFLFTKYEKNGKTEYYGTKKGKVEANSRNFLAELVEGQSYGDADMSRLLNAMLPDSEKSADMPRYAYVKGGRLANGLHYEDYQSRTQHEMNVIRYYFDNHVLVKIAAASYYRDANGKPNGHKCIIRLTEFSARPDMTLLALPEGLRDVTKRKEAKE